MLALHPIAGAPVAGSPWVYVPVGPTLAVSPSSGAVNSSLAVTFKGTLTNWLSSQPTITVSGGSGASLTGQVIVDDFTITATLNTGTLAAQLICTDPSTGDTCTFSVTGFNPNARFFDVPDRPTEFDVPDR